MWLMHTFFYIICFSITFKITWQNINESLMYYIIFIHLNLTQYSNLKMFKNSDIKGSNEQLEVFFYSTK